jgi:hypothetical protein
LAWRGIVIVILYGDFDYHGYKITSYMPSNTDEELVWTIQATKEGEVIKELKVKMNYRPAYGPDMSDVERLNEETEIFIESL